MRSPSFLKQLNLHGFKAFRNKTTINFREGVVAFAGPNGCGKSNVIDAMRWVMGEKKFSDLRGNKMDDLIFFGGSEKNASNFAEVSLTFNNADGLINLDYKEITIKRRVFRSGESECFLNGTQCRLKDITDILLPIFGKSNYSIVAQGRIEEIASGSSESRREVIETIAGIAAFNEKKKEYERRIVSSKQNLKRVNDILRTTEVQKQHLAKQAENSKAYFLLKSQLKDMELLKQKMLYTQLKAQISNTQQLLENLKKEKRDIEKSIVSSRSAKVNIEEQIQASREKILTLEKEKIRSSSLSTINLEKVKMHEILITSAQQNIVEAKASIVEVTNSKKKGLEKIESEKLLAAKCRDEIKTLAETEAQTKTLSQKTKEEERDLIAKKKEIQEKIAVLTKHIDSQDEEIDTSTENILKKLKDVTTLGAKTKLLSSQNESSQDEIAIFLDNLEQRSDEILKLVQNANYDGIQHRKRLETELNQFFSQTLLLKKEFAVVTSIVKPLIQVYENRLNILSTIENEKKEVQNLLKENVQNERATKETSEKIFHFQKTLHELSLKNAQLNYALESVLKRKKTLSDNSANFENEIININAQIEKAEKKLKDLNEERELVLNDKQSQQDYELEAKKKIEHEEGINRGLFQKLNIVEKELSTKISKEHQKQEEVGNTSNKVQLLKNDLEHLKKNVHTLFNENIEKYEARGNFRMESLERNIALAKLKIDKMGRINPLAQEEYAEIKSKSDKQQQEKNDALNSIEDLFKLSKSLEEKSKITFQEVFSEVSNFFAQFVAELFPGGTGKLNLLNPAEPLSSGVEIGVELPGKKMRKMDLFSGGEKTLIALAFIFALFSTRKTPFCVLDEVDAALDNENISRFINLIQKHSQGTQFIIVSHNQNTFSAINYVYGISMQSGISQVFSLKVPAVAGE